MCWHEYKPAGFHDPNGRRWEQSKGYHDAFGRWVDTHYIWTLTDDEKPIAPNCDDGTKERPRCCIHVRYRNNVREVVHICFVRPPDVLGLMASV